MRKSNFVFFFLLFFPFHEFVKVLTGLICGWLVAFMLCIPPLFQVAPYRYNTDLGICAPHFEMTGTLWYALVFTLITLIIPSILIIGCNIRVSFHTETHTHRHSLLMLMLMSQTISIYLGTNDCTLSSPSNCRCNI